MSRTGLRFALCAVLVAAALAAVAAGPGDKSQARIRNQLAVQAAFEQGLDALQRGQYEAAVVALEKQLALIDGNRRYLETLRDAYRGYVQQLVQAARHAEAAKFRRRLEILDPSARDKGPARPALAAATPARAAQSKPKARAKTEEDDPFAESNRAGPNGASAVLARAERAFSEKRYADACLLYQQAHATDSAATADCRERWAYCKMFRVVQALNGKELAPAAELEREVRQALSMAPKLDSFGQDLLRKIRSRSARPAGAASGEVAVKHTPRQGNGWALAETTNFRIFHTLPQDQGERVARVAEATREAMTRRWFNEIPGAWSPRCDLYVHATASGYARATGAPQGSPGHSTMSIEAGRVVSRRMDVRADDPNMVTGVLPHETTHVVLAGRFGRHHVPRWADEGMAVLTEPRERINLHLGNLPMHRRQGELFRVGELMKMNDYPEPRRIGAFYAQSVSLVEFLSQKKGYPTFARFLREGLDGGYEPALARHYGYRSFAEMERDWTEYAFGGGVARTSESPKR
jgi:tetratricopeptide (TPR) repeat protein